MKRITSMLLVVLLTVSAITTADTNVFAKETATQESTTITVNGTDYNATYLETQELDNEIYKSREIWQLDEDIKAIYETRIPATFGVFRSLYLSIKLPTGNLEDNPLGFIFVYTAHDGSISNNLYYYTGYSEGRKNKLYHYVMEEIYIGNSLSDTESDNAITVEFERDEYDATYLGRQEYQENEYRDFWRIDDTEKMLDNTIVYHTRIPFNNVPIEIGNFNKPEEQFLVVDTVSQGNVNREVCFFNGAMVDGENTDRHTSMSEFYYKNDEYYAIINTPELPKGTGKIYLYGEEHGREDIITKEFDLWKGYYDSGMRHLVMEHPFVGAEYLNLWMKADDNEILDRLYEEWEGSAIHIPFIYDFYQRIKQECPETVFHGTDVGHSGGILEGEYLEYLEAQDTLDVEKYLLTLESIEQGEGFRTGINGWRYNDEYREYAMVSNFIREFDKLNGEDVMVIYGATHANLTGVGLNSAPDVPVMGNQLNDRYVNQISSTDLTR